MPHTMAGRFTATAQSLLEETRARHARIDPSYVGGAVLRATYDLSGKRIGDCPKG